MDAQFAIILDRKIMDKVYQRVFFRKSWLRLILTLVPTIWFLWISLQAGIFIPIVLWAVIAATMWLFFYSRTMRLARLYVCKWGEHEVAYRVADEGLHVSAPHGNAMIPWHVAERVWRYSDLWLVFIDPVNIYILPADKVAGKVGDFIVAKVRENGGKVK